MGDNSNLPQNNSEEIDLIQLFGFFEQKIKGFFKIFFSIFEWAFNIVVCFLKLIQQYTVKIGMAVLIALVLGVVYDYFKPKVYGSTMIVKPLFESKYQLVTNIKYYNELVKNESGQKKLANIFNISPEEARELKSFDIKDGPQSEKEKTRLYNEFMKSLDSAAAATVNYDRFVENITIYDASLYEIKVLSSKNDVFGRLSKGFKKTFKDGYSKDNKEKKDTILKYKREAINNSLKNIKELKKVYIEELKKDQDAKIEVLGNTAFKLQEDNKKTKEFELLELQIEEQQKLNDLEEEAIEESQLFEIISDFQPIGSINGGILSKMKIVFPIGAIFLSILFILGVRFNKFLKEYKG